VSGFPFARRDVRGRFSSLLAETEWDRRPADLRILCLHQTVEGARVGPSGYTFLGGRDVIPTAGLPARFSAVLSGHIHRYQVLDCCPAGRRLATPVLYPGSMERTSFAERDERKGYLLVDLEPGPFGGRLAGSRFVELPTRPMLDVELDVSGLGSCALAGCLRERLARLDPDGVVRLRLHGRLAACTADLSLPDEVQIACGEGTRCPEGWMCRPKAGRCVALGALDTEPPGLLGEPRITPPVGSHTTRFLVAFAVTESLALDPDVAVRERALDLWEREGESYVYSYVPSGAEPEGAAPVTARLVDVAGNESEGLACGALVFDVTAPSVVAGSAVVEPEVAGAGTVVRIRFAVDEPLAVPPEVRVGDGDPARPAETQPGDGSLLFEHMVEPGGAEGEAAVTVRLEDEVGNVRPRTEVGVVRLDFTPPRLTGTPTFERCDGRTLARVAANDLWVGLPACGEGEHAVTVHFTVSDRPGGGAWPAVSVAGEPLALDEERSVPPYYVAHLDPDGDEPESAPGERPEGQPVVALTADAAGNEATLELGRLRFDFTPPPAPEDEETLSRIVYERDPWGSEGSGYLPRQRLRVAPDAFEEEGEVSVWAVADPAAPGTDPEGELYVRSLLGRTELRPGEESTVPAGSSDRPLVHVTFSDRAGNESDSDGGRSGAQASPVALVEWVGTFNGKVVGDPGSNPHALVEGVHDGEGGVPLDVYARPVEGQLPYLAAARADGQDLARARSTDAPWTHHPTGLEALLESPMVDGFGIAYHERSRRLVLFGGRSWTQPYPSVNDTWEWDGRDWLLRQPLSAPSARLGPTMVYDADRGRVVLFGGTVMGPGGCSAADPPSCSETWTWDGADWRRRTPDDSPSRRATAGMAYDSTAGTVVLFGGYGEHAGACGREEDILCSDTWTWDGGSWTERDPVASPGERWMLALAQDVARGRVVLFGGWNAFLQPLTDLWHWDGAGWQRPEPFVVAPGRYGPGLAYDPIGGGVLVFGGRGDGHGACSEGERDAHCPQARVYAPARWRPHLVPAFDLRAASTIEPSGADPSAKTLRSITVRASAGGVGPGPPHRAAEDRRSCVCSKGHSQALTGP